MTAETEGDLEVPAPHSDAILRRDSGATSGGLFEESSWQLAARGVYASFCDVAA